MAVLGHFDLDPCAPTTRPWSTADRHLTIEDDGLTADWGDDFVWCNPPYGRQTWAWLDRLSAHPPGGVALIFARTETAGFFASVWRRSSALLFLEGRLFFHYVDGTKAAANSGAPSVLVGYGTAGRARLAEIHQQGRVAGAFVDCWDATKVVVPLECGCLGDGTP